MQWLALVYVYVPVDALCLVRSEEGDGSPRTGNKIPQPACLESTRVTPRHGSQATYSKYRVLKQDLS